ncbi:MAG: hypothetical protein U1G08_17910 [Verrucomicrobiota bacterium]
MRNPLSILAIAAALLGLPAFGQYQPIAKSISINPTNSVLLGPLDFFPANSNHVWRILGITNLDSLAKATNGVQVSPQISGATLGGTTTIPSGATVSGASGASISFDRVTISGTPSAPTDATTKGIVDSLGNLIYIVVPPKIVNDLSGLTGASVGTVSRFCYVRNSTSGDGAMGLWIWDPTSTTAEGAVVKKSSNLDPGDPGRWLKL